MNHCVPEFDMDEDCALPSSSSRHKNIREDEIMELLWQDGQVVVHTQNPRLSRKSPQRPSHHQAAASHPPPASDSSNHLFMQEDEMNTWLHYPLEDPSFHRDFTDLFSQPAPEPPPPPPPPAGVNFPHFSRMPPGSRIPDIKPSTSSRNNEPPVSTTVVDSSDTPAMRQKSSACPPRRSAVEAYGGGYSSYSGAAGGTSLAGGGGSGCLSIGMSREEGETCEVTHTSSPSGDGDDVSASVTATADLTAGKAAAAAGGCRKRKAREAVDDATTEDQSEDLEIESYDAKKQARGGGGGGGGGGGIKRSRAAEVHNLSERKRRDRINERMKALQELIPRCSKTDKASMLDEAIEYLKSLQLQVQMMSMGCGMVPMMFPGVQQYMPSMGMGMGMGLGMGMGMGMEMGMNRPMMPFPTPGTPAHMNPRFPLQAFPMPHVPGQDPSRMQQVSNQMDVSANPLGILAHTMAARIPNLADPYQQCMGKQHMPMPMQIPQPGTRKPTTDRGGGGGGGDGDHEKHPTG